MSTLQEWLADPHGSELLRKEIGTDETGRLNGVLGDEEFVKIVGNFPIRRLAALPGVGISHVTVQDLVDHASMTNDDDADLGKTRGGGLREAIEAPPRS